VDQSDPILSLEINVTASFNQQFHDGPFTVAATPVSRGVRIRCSQDGIGTESSDSFTDLKPLCQPLCHTRLHKKIFRVIFGFRLCGD
jgi:hypothetical protein